METASALVISTTHEEEAVYSYVNTSLTYPTESVVAMFALDVAREVQAQLEHDVFSTVWNEGVFFAGGYSLEALEKAVSEADFAIAIAQADDLVETRGNEFPTLRDNVLFELGLFMGKLTRHRAVLGFPVVLEKFLALREDGPRLTERP
jgi:CRP/FNR family transcriptional regulator, cyclic AMP receptor protein